MAELQRVLEAAPGYAKVVTGADIAPSDAQSIYTTLPEGKAYEDKFVFGVFRGPTMVGCVDLIRGYPDVQTAYLGLILIDERYQGRGVGKAVYRLIEAQVRAWPECHWLRLGVVRSNIAVLPFWQRLGFVETGELKPYRFRNMVSEVLVLAKPLSRIAP